MSKIAEIVIKAFKEMLEKGLSDLVDIFVDFISSIVLNYDGLAGTAMKTYNIFIWLSGLLLVVLCLVEIIKMLLSEADSSQEANVWAIIVNTIRSGFMLVLAPFIISITMTVVKALTEVFFDDMGETLKNNISNFLNSSSSLEIHQRGVGTIILFLFVIIVLGAFIIKMIVEQTQILMLEILSPIVAVSVMNENMNYINNWAKDLLSHAVTIVVLALSMALFIEATGGFTDGDVLGFISVLGTGALVIKGPSLIQSIRYKSGVGRAGQSAMRMAFLKKR